MSKKYLSSADEGQIDIGRREEATPLFTKVKLLIRVVGTVASSTMSCRVLLFSVTTHSSRGVYSIGIGCSRALLRASVRRISDVNVVSKARSALVICAAECGAGGAVGRAGSLFTSLSVEAGRCRSDEEGVLWPTQCAY